MHDINLEKRDNTRQRKKTNLSVGINFYNFEN